MASPNQDREETRESREADLIAACGELIAECKAAHPDEDLATADADRLVFEAQVLLVCEEIHRGNMTDRRIQQAVMDIRNQKQSDILGIVRQRLFERPAYGLRLKGVETVFQQLIRGDMNRTAMRPAKLT